MDDRPLEALGRVEGEQVHGVAAATRGRRRRPARPSSARPGTRRSGRAARGPGPVAQGEAGRRPAGGAGGVRRRRPGRQAARACAADGRARREGCAWRRRPRRWSSGPPPRTRTGMPAAPGPAPSGAAARWCGPAPPGGTTGRRGGGQPAAAAMPPRPPRRRSEVRTTAGSGPPGDGGPRGGDGPRAAARRWPVRRIWGVERWFPAQPTTVPRGNSGRSRRGSRRRRRSSRRWPGWVADHAQVRLAARHACSSACCSGLTSWNSSTKRWRNRQRRAAAKTGSPERSRRHRRAGRRSRPPAAAASRPCRRPVASHDRLRVERCDPPAARAAARGVPAGVDQPGRGPLDLGGHVEAAPAPRAARGARRAARPCGRAARGPDAPLGPAGAQLGPGDGVERAGGGPCRAAPAAPAAGGQLAGRLAGEGQRQHVAGIGVPVLASGARCGASAPGSCPSRHRPGCRAAARVGDRPALLGPFEPGEQSDAGSTGPTSPPYRCRRLTGSGGRGSCGAVALGCPVPDVSPARFEELVGRPSSQIPEDRAMHRQRGRPGLGRPPPRACSGCYEGVPLTERAELRRLWRMPGPDHRLPPADCAPPARDEDELVEEVRITVVHELAHHFGIDDDRLDELGWG